MKLEVKRNKLNLDLEAYEAIAGTGVDLSKPIPINEVMRFENGTLITANLDGVIISGFVSPKEGKQVAIWIQQGKHLNYSTAGISVGKDKAKWKRTEQISAKQKRYVSYILLSEADKDSVIEADDPDFVVFGGAAHV